MSAQAKSLPDAEARRRIAEELGTNFLVEAGAGAGKTTALVGRMVALVGTGRARVEQIAAVTFTRKAATELRERFQLRLERDLRAARTAGDGDRVARCDQALRDLDQCVMGTVHSFCARLLRERPLDARLDPSFEEVSGAEERRLEQSFWEDYIEERTSAGDPLLERLAGVGLRPHQLRDVFTEVVGNPDVDWPAPGEPRPYPGPGRRKLEAWLDRAAALLPAEEPAGGWDSLQGRVRALLFSRRVLGWRSNEPAFFDALAMACGSAPKPTLKAWSPDKAVQADVKAVRDALEELGQPGGPAQELLAAWYAHRYPLVIEFARRAASAYAERRRSEGALSFSDLLTLAARMLRESAAARRALGERFRHLLIDEFQDTDPVQAEIAFLLAAADPGVSDWRQAVPREGALFVVGDPKQSIYRFRRADITIYNAVKARFREWGDVLPLTANFRSREPIARLVNAVFSTRFPAEGDEHQAAFAEMRVLRDEPVVKEGVFTYALLPAGSKSKEAIGELDAERLAGWIAARVESGERRPGDFLVLSYRKECLAGYARELERHGLPVQVTGAGVGVEAELGELLLLLRALAEPEDEARVVGVLTGLFFGLDFEVLTAHALASPPGERWRFRDPGAPPGGPVDRALSTLGRWARLIHAEPADVAVERIVEEVGLLPLAAAGELGETRAGALRYVLEQVRTAALDGESSLSVALEILDAALTDSEAETPLDPGRTDVVRVMNLHKAKGLEAPVVVLAYPTGMPEVEPLRYVERPREGGARGHLRVVERDGWVKRTLACPRAWEEYAAREARYAAAELMRLLYVAATRAEDELVVARCAASEAKSPWLHLHGVLDQQATPLLWDRRDPPERPRLERAVEDILRPLAGRPGNGRPLEPVTP